MPPDPSPHAATLRPPPGRDALPSPAGRATAEANEIDRADRVDADALVAKDAAAWAEAYDRYSASTYAFLAHLVGGSRPLAEELHQELWLAALSAIERFDPDRGAFRGWLFGIARNRVAMHLRKAAPPADRGAAALAEETAGSDERLAAEALAAVERDDAVRAALVELGDPGRTVLLGKYVESLPVAEIAERIGRSPKAVESLLSRARERLRHLLRGYRPHPADAG